MSFFPKSKFGRDVLWSLGAFAVQGVCGLGLNVLIGRFYGPAPLGLFNQIFALYIFASQLAVFGLHFSALKHVAQHRDEPETARCAAVSSVLLTVGTATVVTLLCLIAAPLLRLAFDSPNIERAWLLVLPGLWFFSVNKTLLAIVNAFSHMRAFAVAQSARYLLLLGAVFFCVLFNVPGEWLSGIITCTELLLGLGLACYFARMLGATRLGGCRSWVRRHMDFGYRSFLSGTVIELNSRVDIILLGFYTDASHIGVYSIAALFAEGMAQVYTMLRNVVNPIITRCVVNNEYDELHALRLKVSRIIWLISAPCGILAIIIYPIMVRQLTANSEFGASISVFSILTVALILSAGYQPFFMALIQSGFPGLQTIFMASILAVNVLGNTFLIPAYGIDGAAAATGASVIAGVFLLQLLFRRRTGYSL